MIRKFPQWVFWAVIIFLSVVFVLTGVSKLAGPSAGHWATRFSRWHYPPYLSRIVGLVEITCGLGILLNLSRRISVVILMVTMGSALCTHLLFGEFIRVIPPLLLGSLCFLVDFSDPHGRN
jgi:uncharacterized membrane protein YphA (DoxX/SURF4 family)